MRSAVAAFALLGVLLTAGQASATYRLGQNPSMQERERYKWTHTSLDQFHAAEASDRDPQGRTMLTIPEPQVRAPFGPGNKILPASEAERRWFEQAQGTAW